MNEISVTVSSDHVVLAQGSGSVTVSVTNVAPQSERIVLGAFGASAAAAPVPAPAGAPPVDPVRWTTIDRPLREIGPGATEQYVVSFAAADAPAGTYQVKLIAYSADRAPEEYSDQGRQIRLEVPGRETPVATSGKPWWIVALVAVLLVAVGGVAFFLLRSDKEPVPGVLGEEQATAEGIVTEAGFEPVSTLTFGRRGDFGRVITQSPEPDAKAAPGSEVSLTVARGLQVDKLNGLQSDQALLVIGSAIGVDVQGMTNAEAIKAIGEELTVTLRAQAVSLPVGQVFQVETSDGTPVAQGDTVTLVVSQRVFKNPNFELEPLVELDLPVPADLFN